MEELYREVPNNPVPYRATRTFPNVPDSIERRFEPSWARNSSYSSGFASSRVANTVPSTVFTYTRDDIFSIINSISIHPPPPRNLQAFEIIFSKDTSVSIKLLDKSYYTPDPSDNGHTHSIPSLTNPNTFETRGLSGRGRGRGLDYSGSWGGPASSSAKWSTRGPIWRSRFSSESTEISSSQPRRRFLSESSHSDTFSEEMSESPRDKVPDWQYFPNDETCKQDYYPEREQPPEKENIKLLSTSQQNEFDGRELSWSDTSSFIRTKKRNEPQTEAIPLADKDFPKGLESNSFSFLNPSNVDAADPISNSNQSNSISNNTGDSTKHSQTYQDEFEIVEPSHSDLKTDPQDPKHLWYYVDPKGSIQGPFLSEQMDNWYSRKFFPPTLPVWRECDSKPFKLANLLNVTNMSDEPFSVGAGRLLMPREFSPVDILVREFMPEIMNDSQEVTCHQNGHVDTELELTQFPLKPDTLEEVVTVEQDVNHKEITLDDSTPDKHAGKVGVPLNTVFQFTQMEFVNETTNKPLSSDFIPIPDTCNSDNFIAQPTRKNNWFNGPPKIPEQKDNPVDTPSPPPTSCISDSFLNMREDNPTKVKAVPISKKEGPENQINEEKSKSTSSASHNPVVEDYTNWKKVGDINQKTKIKNVSQSDFNHDALQVEESVLSNTKVPYISKSKNSTHRSKLDELDSFSISRQSVKLSPPVYIPNPQNEAPIVNLDIILSEQSLEEVSNNNLKRAMLSTRKLEEATYQAKKHTWTSSPTDIVPLSFLAIESEQKKTHRESVAVTHAEKIRFKESQTTNQPVSVSTWARVTKNFSESIDEPGPGKGETAPNKRTNAKPVATVTGTDKAIETPVINSKSEDFTKPKQKGLATKLQAPGIIPDGILLSQTCYERSRKEILSLNKLVDPATVICFLQEFNELFEMTQLGSEMLGTSERTNALCKRIYEDLARVKKSIQKSTMSQENDEDWIKVIKKTGKTAKRKGRPSKSSEN